MVGVLAEFVEVHGKLFELLFGFEFGMAELGDLVEEVVELLAAGLLGLLGDVVAEEGFDRGAGCWGGVRGMGDWGWGLGYVAF